MGTGWCNRESPDVINCFKVLLVDKGIVVDVDFQEVEVFLFDVDGTGEQTIICVDYLVVEAGMVVATSEHGDGERFVVAFYNQFVGVIFFILLLEDFDWDDDGCATEFFGKVEGDGAFTCAACAMEEDDFVALVDSLDDFLHDVFLCFSVGEGEWWKILAFSCFERPGHRVAMNLCYIRFLVFWLLDVRRCSFLAVTECCWRACWHVQDILNELLRVALRGVVRVGHALDEFCHNVGEGILLFFRNTL